MCLFDLIGSIDEKEKYSCCQEIAAKFHQKRFLKPKLVFILHRRKLFGSKGVMILIIQSLSYVWFYKYYLQFRLGSALKWFIWVKLMLLSGFKKSLSVLEDRGAINLTFITSLDVCHFFGAWLTYVCFPHFLIVGTVYKCEIY